MRRKVILARNRPAPYAVTMELRLLSYFAAVCEHGSLHAAAAAVRVAQPSLSRQIRNLETRLGFALFERTPKGLVPTAAGRNFLPVARDLLLRASQAEFTASMIAKGNVTELSVVSASTTVTDIIAPFIVEKGEQGLIRDVVEVAVAEQVSEQIYMRLIAGEADFAVGTRIPPATLNYHVIGHAYLWAQVPDGHRFVGRDWVSISELVKEPLIMVTSAHYVRHMFDVAVAAEGLTYSSAAETASPTTAQALTAAGRGVCVISDDSRYGLHSIPIRAQGSDITFPLFGVWEPLHFASREIEQVLVELSEFTAHLYPQVWEAPHPFPARRVVYADRSVD